MKSTRAGYHTNVSRRETSNWQAYDVSEDRRAEEEGQGRVRKDRRSKVRRPNGMRASNDHIKGNLRRDDYRRRRGSLEVYEEYCHFGTTTKSRAYSC